MFDFARHAPRVRGVFTLILAGLSGCTASTRVISRDYDLAVALDVRASRIDATATLHCSLPDAGDRSALRALNLDLDLHPDLEIQQVTATDAKVGRVRVLAGEDAEKSENGARTPRTHRVTLEQAAPAFDLTVTYSGKLWQDVSTGERRGEIHNFEVSAHIGTNGVYLAGANWYPTIHADVGDEAPAPLVRYRAQIAKVRGHTFVCSAARRGPDADDGTLRFESDFPQPELVIMGGRYRAFERAGGQVALRMLLAADGVDEATLQRRADLFLSAAAEYLARYQPLVGPYPYREFTIVENFFSSGFAFPTFTLLGPAVVAMEERSLRHGYLDHEMLHSWWGNSVYVDPRDGNWCEALTSFAANLHGYELDGDAAGARKARRDVCNALSRLEAKDDLPLDTFGQENGAGRTVGYQKGSLVFHMLAREIGLPRFWQAMRTLTSAHTGKYADWGTLRQVCEEASGADLRAFFDQWIHGRGAPRFTLTSACWDESQRRLRVGVRQEGTSFAVKLPLRVYHADGSVRDVSPVVNQQESSLIIAPDDALDNRAAPVEVELDPEYHVVRRLTDDEMLPTVAGCLRGDQAVIVSADTSGLWDGYRTFLKDVRSKRKDDTTKLVSAAAPDALGADNVVVIGDAVRDPAVQELLSRAECPVQWIDAGFRIDQHVFAGLGQAVLCCLRHPDRPAATITIYYGNSAEALGNAGILWFYGNSLLVFQAGPTGDPTPPKVILRRDFEHTQRIPVTRKASSAAG